MKKSLILVLSVLVLTFVFVGCDATIRQNVAGFMGNFSGNVYLDNGIIEPNTADAQAASNTIATIGTGAGAATVTGGGTTDTFGIAGVTVPDGVTTILKPQTTEEQTALKDSLASTLSSPTQTQTLLTELAKPVTDTEQKAAAQGTVLVFNATLEQIKTELGAGDLANVISELKLPEIGNDEEITQGDLLMLQMMTNLVKNTVETLKSASTGGDLSQLGDLSSSENKAKVESIVNDALFTAQLAEQLSGAANIDFSGQLNLSSLISDLNKGARTSRDSGDDDIAIAPIINSIMPDIVKLMGVTKSGTTYSFSADKYQSFLLNQRTYRSSIEHGIKMAGKAGIQLTVQNAEFDTSTLIKYLLSVLFTEHHAYWEDEKKKDDSITIRPRELILAYLNQVPGLGDGTLADDFDFTSVDVTLSGGFTYDNWPAFLETRDADYYKNIVGNLIKINSINGIAPLNEFLEELRDEGIDDWLGDL